MKSQKFKYGIASDKLNIFHVCPSYHEMYCFVKLKNIKLALSNL